MAETSLDLDIDELLRDTDMTPAAFGDGASAGPTRLVGTGTSPKFHMNRMDVVIDFGIMLGDRTSGKMFLDSRVSGWCELVTTGRLPLNGEIRIFHEGERLTMLVGRVRACRRMDLGILSAAGTSTRYVHQVSVRPMMPVEDILQLV